jgi:hypothetical protein
MFIGKLFHFLQKRIEAVEALLPEGAVELKPAEERSEPSRPGLITRLSPLAPPTHQACLAEKAKVL